MRFRRASLIVLYNRVMNINEMTNDFQVRQPSPWVQGHCSVWLLPSMLWLRALWILINRYQTWYPNMAHPKFYYVDPQLNSNFYIFTLYLLFSCRTWGIRRMATGLAVLRRPLMSNLSKDPRRSPARSPGPGPGHLPTSPGRLPTSPGRHRGTPPVSPGPLPTSPAQVRLALPVSPGPLPLQPLRTPPVSPGALPKTSPVTPSSNAARKRRVSQESEFGKNVTSCTYIYWFSQFCHLRDRSVNSNWSFRVGNYDNVFNYYFIIYRKYLNIWMVFFFWVDTQDLKVFHLS